MRQTRRRRSRRILRDEALLAEYRGVQPCWWCGRTLPCVLTR